MTSIRNSIQKYIDDAGNFDTWLFMDTPISVGLITVAYLYFTISWGPKYMENRDAFQLKTTLLLYNLYNVLFSAIHFVISVYLYINLNLNSYLCGPDLPADLEIYVKYVGWWYFFSKIVELLDTIFFVMRKKQNQVTFLHLYHHTIMVISCWFYLKYLPGQQGILIGILNTFVHIVMYTYYFLSSFGPKFQKYLWWKKYITILQLIQFALVLLYIAYLFMAECKTAKFLSYYIFGNAVIFIYLFSDFYVKAYTKKTNDKVKRKD